MIKNLLDSIKKQPIWVIFVLIFITISVQSNEFLRIRNLANVGNQISIYGILAIGITYLLISGNWDLSIGSNMAIAAGLTIALQEKGIVLSIIVAFIVSMSIGLINGVIVTQAKINSFIATMSMNLVLRGFVYIIIGERAILGKNPMFSNIFSYRIGGLIPVVIPVFLILLIIFSYLLKNSAHGRTAYAVGGNMEATVNAGIDVDKHIILNYVLCGFCAALTGVFLAGQMNAATAVFGNGYDMLVMTMVLVGGTKCTGGDGSLTQTFGGLLVINVLRNGMDQLGIDSNYNTMIMGLILLIFVFVDTDGSELIKKLKRRQKTEIKKKRAAH